MKILIFIAYVLLRMFERLFLIVSSLSGMAAYIIAGAAMVVGAIMLIMWFTADEEHANLLPSSIVLLVGGLVISFVPNVLGWLLARLTAARIRLGLRIGIAPPDYV